MTMEIPWISITEAAPMFGMTVSGIRNSIFREKFPVPTYRLGKQRVIDKVVLAAYFEKKKSAGLSALANTPN